MHAINPLKINHSVIIPATVMNTVLSSSGSIW